MRAAIIAPPFIPVPPQTYGGTELFIAQLASGLTELGHDRIAGSVPAPGDYLLRVRYTRYWLIERGHLCLAETAEHAGLGTAAS